MPYYSTEEIKHILTTVKVIALVGASPNPARPSSFVLQYLLEKGYDVYPVNPLYKGQEACGRPILETLASIGKPIDMVDVFRNSHAVSEIVTDMLALSDLPKVLWMQLGVINEEEALRARAAGVSVIMDRCPKIEYGKLCGEWAWVGGNSGIISSKKPKTRGKFQSLTVKGGSR